MIEKHLSHIDFTRFKLEELTADDENFYLPYVSEEDGRTHRLRFYLTYGEVASSPGRLVIPIGGIGARVVCEGWADVGGLYNELYALSRALWDEYMRLKQGDFEDYDSYLDALKELVGEPPKKEGDEGRKGRCSEQIDKGKELIESIDRVSKKRKALRREEALRELDRMISAALKERDYYVVGITGRSGVGRTTVANVIGSGIDNVSTSELITIHCSQFFNNVPVINQIIRNCQILNRPLNELSDGDFEKLGMIARGINMPWPPKERGRQTFINYYNRFNMRQAGLGTVEKILMGHSNVDKPMRSLTPGGFESIKKLAYTHGIEPEELEKDMDMSLREVLRAAEHDEFMDAVATEEPLTDPIKLFIVEGTYSYQGEDLFNPDAERLESDATIFIEVDEETRRERIRRRGRPTAEAEVLEMEMLDVVYSSSVDRQRELADIILDNNRETNEYQIVTTSDGLKIQFGIPTETTKDIMSRESLGGGKGPDVFVLPHELFHGGRNYADVEFLLYYNYFRKGGKRVTLVGSPEQIKNLKVFVQHSLFGPDHSSASFRSYDADTQRFIRTAYELYAVRDSESGAILDLDAYFDFVEFEDGKALVGREGAEVQISRLNLNQFSVSEVGKDRSRRLSRSITARRPRSSRRSAMNIEKRFPVRRTSISPSHRSGRAMVLTLKAIILVS